ncbi:MAG TPA: YkgJ family cysteine cluster protein, partial [Myxococcota bacterium]|nr:YkgJ family cysteine cluster protein [Myxococcota bacterium]
MKHARLPILPETARAAPLPTVAALESLWREVAHRPLWAPPNFFRYLRLRWRTRLALLDPTTVRLRGTVGKINDCSACSDICCSGPRSTVLLRLTDIAMLMDIGRTDLMTHAKPQFKPEELRARPALRRQVASEAWARFPVLRQNEFGACEALTAAGKCSIYPHWPLACARFPYALHAEAQEIFYSQRCRSFWVHPRAAARVQQMAVAVVVS